MLCLANAPRNFFPNHYSNGLNTSHSNGGVNENSTLTNDKSTHNKVLLMKSAGVLLETGTAYPSRAPEFTPGFFFWGGGGPCCSCFKKQIVLSDYVSDFRVVMFITISA